MGEKMAYGSNYRSILVGRTREMSKLGFINHNIDLKKKKKRKKITIDGMKKKKKLICFNSFIVNGNQRIRSVRDRKVYDFLKMGSGT